MMIWGMVLFMFYPHFSVGNSPMEKHGRNGNSAFSKAVICLWLISSPASTCTGTWPAPPVLLDIANVVSSGLGKHSGRNQIASFNCYSTCSSPHQVGVFFSRSHCALAPVVCLQFLTSRMSLCAGNS